MLAKIMKRFSALIRPLEQLIFTEHPQTHISYVVSPDGNVKNSYLRTFPHP